MPAPSRSTKGFVGVLVAELYFPESGSLKDKRMHLRRIRDYLTSRRGVSFAEVGHQALWQRSRVLVAVAASDVQWLQETLERVREYLDGHEWVLTSYETEVMDVDS